MANNTLLDALEEIGRGTAREIAEKLKIEPFEALELLREHQDLGEVEFMNGAWCVVPGVGCVEQVAQPEPELEPEVKEAKEVSDLASDSATATATAAAPESEVILAIKLAPGIQGDIIQLLSNHGAMTIKELAAKMGRSAQAVASPMYALKDKGVVVKDGTRRERSWRLLTQPAPTSTQAPAPASVSSEGIVKTIPAFTATATATNTTETATTATSIAREGDLVGQCIQDSFIYGLMTRANQEKQYAIERVAKLDEVCEALNVLHKHQALIQQFKLSDGKPEGGRA
ncbi:TPA: DUF1627 domain-containing protein [Salmonella enterica subsp. enterica serovar Dublin]|nr:DUF1627 domain-containing protein [Salmonella enterica subsp. enterica serovar Dublin]